VVISAVDRMTLVPSVERCSRAVLKEGMIKTRCNRLVSTQAENLIPGFLRNGILARFGKFGSCPALDDVLESRDL
jgi:hypothetical protein